MAPKVGPQAGPVVLVSSSGGLGEVGRRGLSPYGLPCEVDPVRAMNRTVEDGVRDCDFADGELMKRCPDLHPVGAESVLHTL